MKNLVAGLAAGTVLMLAFGNVAAEPRNETKTNWQTMKLITPKPATYRSSGDASIAYGWLKDEEDTDEPSPGPYTPNPGGCYEDHDLQMTICD